MKVIIILLLCAVFSCNSVPPPLIPLGNTINFDSLDLVNTLTEYFQNEGKEVKFPNDFINLDFDSVLIDDYLDSEKTLILFISRKACLACCYNQVELFCKTFNSNLATNAVVIADFKPNREFYVFWKDNKIEIPLLYIDDNNKYLPVTDSNHPFYFISDKNRKVELFFSPIEGNDKLTDIYLSHALEHIKSTKIHSQD